MSHTFPLESKTFLVVGAGGLIGRKTVEHLQLAKANVIAADSSKKSLDSLKNDFEERSNIDYIYVDINSNISIENLFERTEKKYNLINGAVNTAYPRNKSYGQDLLNVTHADFSENLSLHLGGYFLFMQQCLKYSIRSNQSFSLVNISSIYGKMAPRFSVYEKTKMTMPVEYAAVKSALTHLSSYFTAYTKAYHKKIGFRVNCISPGGILSSQDPSFLDKYNSHCLKQGMLNADDITQSIAFLLSDHSNSIYSQDIIVDNGFSI